ncbi:hypothetical protein ACFL2Y_05500 [Candidatus Omnitrophota bacterium]
MQNKKLIILIVLGVLAISSLIYGIVTPSKVRRGLRTEKRVIHKKEEATITKSITPAARRVKRSDYDSWGRSPFTLKKVVDKTIRLNGIVWDEHIPKAIINDYIVGIGDTIGENTVVDIKQDRVILSDGTRTFELRLERQNQRIP